MKNNRLKCVMLLSDKSSGSSILQKELIKHPDIKVINKTRHFENETLYWNKAAALLKKPRVTMKYSELPYSYNKAKKEIIKILRDNGYPDYVFKNDEEMIFKGWHLLCEKFTPIFFEKSPHHLHDWSALELIHSCSKKYPDIDFYFIGLIRNPIDTLYSMWKRWKAIPEKRQFEWARAYNNLIKFRDLPGIRVHIITYENLVTYKDTFQQLCRFMGIECSYGIGEELHTGSLHKWKEDKSFGFQLDHRITMFATQFYKKEELFNNKRKVWTFYRNIHTLSYKIVRCKVKIIAALKHLLRLF